MHIMTDRGWQALQVKIEPVPFEPEMYTGPIPSYECRSFIKQSEREHAEWVAKRKSMTED